ncbi:hypothetical protein ES708_22095 [subsurface metagenome]
MKKLIYLIVVIVALGLIVSGCIPTAPPAGQDELGTLPTKSPGVLNVPNDYPTIQKAIDAASNGDKIIVGPGEWFGAVVDKAVEIRGAGGAVIVDGPERLPDVKLGFRVTTDGVTISHFTFEVALPVYTYGGEDKVNDVTVEHNVMINPVQGITNWGGSRWVIRYNIITGLWGYPTGGGIGILVGGALIDPVDPARDNLVAFNKITADFNGQLGHSFAGICLYTKRGEITGNKVVHNDVLITGNDTYAIVMAFLPSTMATPPGICPEDVLNDNKIGFNDLRGSNVGIGYILEKPDGLVYKPVPVDEARELMESCNLISRNLGDNRAYDGIPACEFRPFE